MNLRFVEAFYRVATLGSIKHAADRLSLTQSAVSSRIAALESELDTRLFERRHRKLELTPDGRRLLEHATRLLVLQRELREDLGVDERLSPLVRIGAIESVLHTWLMPFVDDLRAAFPSTKLELTIETTPLLAEHLTQGLLDVAILTMPVMAEGVRHRVLPSLGMALIGPRGTRRTRTPMTVAALASHSLLTFQRGSQPWVALADLLNGAGVEAERLHAASTIAALLKLVERGFGIATLPRAAIHDELASGALVELACETSLPALPIHLAFRPDPTTRALDRVVALACSHAERFRDAHDAVAASARLASKKVNRIARIFLIA